MQNTSHAVMAQRAEARDSLDDFPTPPWATRALIEHVLDDKDSLSKMVCLEPACGVGHMAKVLSEYFGEVRCSDLHPYGYGEVRDYLATAFETNSCDWVITNPPFRLGEQFVLRSLKVARRGVAILARTVFIESVGRYENVFRRIPPTKFAQFTERVPMVKGRLDKKASTATGYCWLVWQKNKRSAPRLMWVPPCRKSLERPGDYDMPVRQTAAQLSASFWGHLVSSGLFRSAYAPAASAAGRW
ncbi:MAG TPA: SAM-dependent methyltransferase [Methyloceanibacter sp.]|nr:SAM-dependent methyltransferase [Methyloceanibacter sp.]